MYPYVRVGWVGRRGCRVVVGTDQIQLRTLVAPCSLSPFPLLLSFTPRKPPSRGRYQVRAQPHAATPRLWPGSGRPASPQPHLGSPLLIRRCSHNTHPPPANGITHCGLKSTDGPCPNNSCQRCLPCLKMPSYSSVVGLLGAWYVFLICILKCLPTALSCHMTEQCTTFLVGGRNG